MKKLLFVLILMASVPAYAATETRSTFQTGIATTLPNNTSGDISPADLRGEFTDLSDSAVFRDEISPFCFALSDETSDLTTGTKITTRAPFAFTLTSVRTHVTTAPVGSVVTVDVNEGGATVLSTKVTIDATEKTSTTAATPAVISDSAIADDAEITLDIDAVGSSTAGAGLKVCLYGTR